ncbi:MAG: hypothetical protein V1850_02000 [Candidatus Bathyarchaeota archaeon]
MRAKFLIRGEFDGSIIRKILDPILMGIDRTTHKVTYKTSKGVVEYVSIPSKASLDTNRATDASAALRKIFLWNRDSTDELEKMLRSKGVEMAKIAGKESKK